MSDPTAYTVHRRVVDPGAGTEQVWGWLNFLSDEETTGTPGVTVGIARINPGAENPLHIHPASAEIVLFLAGSVSHVVGDEVVDVSQGDMLIVPAGVPHQARNVGPQPVEMVVIYNSGRRGYQLLD